jgi:hypothetical protein
MQIFHRSTNTLSRASIYGAVFIVAGIAWALMQIQRSPFITYAGVVKRQPVPFSHQHHVTGLGIDCRYCHTSVEVSSFAGIPPTKTCMNCHSQIWTVYFNHSIHIHKGVGCNTCHGPVDQMPLMYQYASLQMEWCLGCHREPEKYLRPRREVFNMRYETPSRDAPVEVDGQKFTDQESLGRALVAKYKLRSVNDITSCNTCHR